MLKNRLTTMRETCMGLRMGLDVETGAALRAATGDPDAEPENLGLRVDQLERELRVLLSSIQNWRLANNLLREQRFEAAKAARGGAPC